MSPEQAWTVASSLGRGQLVGYLRRQCPETWEERVRHASMEDLVAMVSEIMARRGA